MLNYEFCIQIDSRGNQRPFMMFGRGIDYQHLGNLAQGRMSQVERVKEVLSELQQVMSNEKELFQFSGDDWCSITFRRNFSTVSNGFDEFEPFEIDSNDIYNLIKDWYIFLCAYENGEIPEIIHPDKRIAVSNVPKDELEHFKNNSIFKYQINTATLREKRCDISSVQIFERVEDLQALDNGTLIISQNKFGGSSLISEFTCGYYFCIMIERFINDLKSGKSITVGADDYHSGWDYDFNLKFEEVESYVKVIKDYDYRTEILFEKRSFYHHLGIFITDIKDLFHELYPKLEDVCHF